jgi:hypothetical protein
MKEHDFMSIEDLLKGILGGADSGSSRGRQEADPLSDLLKGILGGASSGGRARPQSGGGDLQDLIGGILGGGAGRGAQDGFGLDDILGGIMGAGAGGIGANSFLAPIAEALAKRLKLSPALAQAVVAFAVSKLLPALLGGRGAAIPGGQAGVRPSLQPSRGGGGLDLDHLLGSMDSGQALEPAYLQSTGLVDELQQQTGLDSDMALQSLQQVFGLFGSQIGGPKPQPKPEGLDHLLDSWEVD